MRAVRLSVAEGKRMGLLAKKDPRQPALVDEEYYSRSMGKVCPEGYAECQKCGKRFKVAVLHRIEGRPGFWCSTHIAKAEAGA